MNFKFEQDITLENARVKLSPIEDVDIFNLLPIATSNTNLLQFSPTQTYNKVLLEKYILSAIQNRKNKIRYTFSVFDKSQTKYVGSTSFLNISNTNDRLEIGATWYGKEFQGTGINENCKYLLLQYAFDGIGAERVEFKTDERNKASRKAIEKNWRSI
ncbi:MAG: GNAT family acetyltransferase [Bacteroidetes bacterium OLB9]|nr:MAG: GNAT family acetyltransferase [Bacteroidetes bacterium OLB9]